MSFRGIHDIQIERSIYKLGATAVIKVPVTARLKYADTPPTEIETAKAIKAGDAVSIELGYKDTYNLEFTGYVKQLNLKTPLEIICEDAFYLTRKQSVTLAGKTTLADVLKKCGLDAAYCATLNLQQFQADNKPVSWILGKLKKDYGLAIFFDLNGRVYAAEPFKVAGDTVKYGLRENVIRDDDLKYQLAEDVKLKIKAVCIYRDGTQVEATIGASDGTEKTIYFYDVKDKSELSALASAELKRYSYDGYSGKIETFLFPYAAPAMLAELRDAVYNERDGRYYVESVNVSFGRSGARRTVEIGLKI
jgi:hypothetical protein